MKKAIFTCIAALLVAAVSAQSVDSIAYQRVDSLIQISLTFTKQRMFDKALETNAEAESHALEIFGMDSEAYGNCCFEKGQIMYQQQDFTKAEVWYLKSKEIREKLLGRTHPDFARCLFMLAIIYKFEDRNELAEEFHLEAKSIFEHSLGKEHSAYAGNLEYLANLYVGLGKYEKAEPLFIEAKTIKEKSLGKMNNPYVSSLRKLAIFYSVSGKYEKAEASFYEAKIIIENILGKQNPEYSAILNSLANLNTLIGNYEKAEIFYLEAKDIRETIYGKEHQNYFATLINLAILYKRMGKFTESEQIFIEAKGIVEKVNGKDHPNYPLLLHNLANLYIMEGRFEQAEPLCLEVNSIWLKAKGKEHPEYAQSLIVMSDLYTKVGKLDQAESLLIEAISIIERVLGNQHIDYGRSIYDLACLYEYQSRYDESTPLLTQALELEQARIIAGTNFLSEMELAKYAYTQQGSVSVHSLLVNRPHKKRSEFQTLSYNQVLFQKGFLLMAGTRMQALVASSPEAISINNDLKGYRRQIAQELTKPISEQKGIAELEEKANALEKDLARTVAGYAEAIRQVKWQEVQKELNSNEAAIEFVNFQVDFPHSYDSIMYAALLLTSKSPQPVFIPLFEERDVQNIISRKGGGDQQEFAAQLYTRGLVPHGVVKNHEGLFDLLWKPLDSLLTGINKIYYSPVGILNQINFDAIPGRFDRTDDVLTLSEKYELVRLGSTRSVVIPDVTPINPSNEIVLYGGIYYDIDTILDTWTDSITIEPVYLSSGFTYALRSVSDKGSDWNYLPGTAREIAEIERIGERVHYPVSVYQGSIATEETVKEIGREKASPRILHFATHGFFFPDPEKASTSRIGLGDTETVFKLSDNPMIRSGLILAAGNYAWQNGKPVSPEKEDGILTAYEISQMNLSNTELVVLSACETGLGDIQGNEGVYGLQRAFKIAGAKYLIMSLWQVPDRETMEFMTTFYRNWLLGDDEAMAGKDEKMSIPDAFRKTQREMRDRFINPYSWAGFVLVE